MKRSALLVLLLLVIAACSPGSSVSSSTTVQAAATTTEPAKATTGDDAFPVTVMDDVGEVTIPATPRSIVSLSATATEQLYAVGAGGQVVAVDDQSDYPAEAPMTELSGFTPNVEAILALEPDLVIASFDPGDLVEGLQAVDVPVLLLGAAFTIDDVYRQMQVVGDATGHSEEATAVNARIAADLDAIVDETGDVGVGVTYYHELDSTLFSVTSSSFIGRLYALLGMENVADSADPGGASFGYPHLSSEYVVTADPQIIYLADAVFGESAETLAARPGWAGMTALETGAVVELDDDIASRWGPRVVDFLQVIADSLDRLTPSG